VTVAASRGERALMILVIRPAARVPQGGQGRVAGQQVPHPGLSRTLAQGPFQGGRDAGQGIAEPVRPASLIGGEVDVEPVEHP
jgi:hypothetical protein